MLPTKFSADTMLSCISDASFTRPLYIPFSAWLEHSPFAFWVIEAVRPRVLVELGTHNGFSFLSFCQAVQSAGLETKCYAVDTWQGDDHAGFYGEEVYATLCSIQKKKYAAFSSLIRSRFDEALVHFSEGSIDLLHIDGRHGYEDVVADYTSWLPKLASDGVVLFHDTRVHHGNFGVWRLWEELSEKFPSFEFVHGHGLGILCPGNVPAGLRPLIESDERTQHSIRAAYAQLGSAISTQYTLEQTQDKLRKQTETTEHTQSALCTNQTLVEALEKHVEDIEERVEHLTRALAEETERTNSAQDKSTFEHNELEAIKASTVWRISCVLQSIGRRLPLSARRQARRILKAAWWTVTPHRMPERIRFLKERKAHPAKRAAAMNVELYLPSALAPLVAPADAVVDVVIPVYRGLDETRQCIESVVADKDRPNGRIIVLDDCSPEPALTLWLEEVAKSGDITLLKNDVNLGFVATVNKGMEEAGTNDVVLLNSDTEVHGGWLRRLAAHAHSSPNIGSVTALSNNATICSYPSFEGGPLALGYSLAELDGAAWSSNKYRSVEIPTGVGFCMYIRRDCLTDVGYFDQATFGKGYGEENDFCMRALDKGWRHLLALDTFVYHAGEVSFGTDSPERQAAWGLVVNRHPTYPELVSKHIALDPGAGHRFALTAALFAESGRPTILLLLHGWGGGTERYVYDVVETIETQANFVLLTAGADGSSLSIPAIPNHPVFTTQNTDDLIALLDTFGINRIHVNHWIGEKYGLQKVVDHLNVPFDVTIHDYYSICPQINLLQSPEKPYCGELGIEQCNGCIAQRPSSGAGDIISWRSNHAWLFHEAARVICPSHDVQIRLQRYFPHANYVVAHHEPVLKDRWEVKAPALGQTEKMRVGLLGVLANHKGRKVVEACIQLAVSNNFPIEFIVIGEVTPEFDKISGRHFRQTGPYRKGELPFLLAEANPHVLWFPAIWPETYSYTLSEAIDSERPIVAAGLGSLPERLVNRPLTWAHNDEYCEPHEWLSLFETVRQALEGKGAQSVEETRARVAPFYPAGYLDTNQNLRSRGELPDLRRQGRVSILVVADSFTNEQISPCGFIRLLLPLNYLLDKWPDCVVEFVAPEAVCHRIADIVICQRHVGGNADTVSRIIKHCRKHNMRLLYDLDDDLLTEAHEHPQELELQRLAPLVHSMLAAADQVWVSTPELRERLSPFHSNIIVLRNYIDERLWKSPLIENEKNAPPVRVLYMGTQTHDVDFQFFKNVAQGLISEFGKGISFEIIGVTADTQLPPSFSRIVPPNSATVSYSAFVSWLVNQNRWDIGVSPLIDNHFNRAKSAIKAMDYAALRLPVIASDVLPYRGVFEEQEGVQLVPNKIEDWVEAIANLVRSPSMRAEWGQRAHAMFLHNHSLAAGFAQWRDAIEKMIATPCQKTMPPAPGSDGAA